MGSRCHLSRAVIEHIIPLSVGGLTERENLWLACHRCNTCKGNRTEATDPSLEGVAYQRCTGASFCTWRSHAGLTASASRFHWLSTKNAVKIPTRKNMTNICLGEMLPDGHLSVTEELRHALEMAPDAQLQVTVTLLQPDAARSQEAWEVFRRLGQDAKPGCLPNAATQHDQYLYGKDN